MYLQMYNHKNLYIRLNIFKLSIHASICTHTFALSEELIKASNFSYLVKFNSC